MKLRVTLNGETFEKTLAGRSLKAGRNPENDLSIPVKEASRVHFKLGRLKDGGWGIRDLGSTNGTVLNGEMLDKTHRLKHGDIISIGRDCTIVFLNPAVPPPSPEPKKKHTGPIVLKTRAQKRQDAEDAARRKRADGRKTARAKVEAQDQAPPEEQPPEDPTVATEAPPVVEYVEIDSEAMLARLMKDKPDFDRILSSEKEVRFGPYTIEQRISEGGMGFVFKAQHRKQKLTVALKLLRNEKVDEENIARFKQEAWAISAFDHPNIVKVRDLSRHAGMYYIAMDFIEGDDLLSLGFKGSLTFWQVMEAIDKLADVLRLVHGRNIWHRDIKPQNILMDNKLEIKLIDFGIATVEREVDAATQTAEGLIMGTPAFLSPEQAARGKLGDIDGRADLYSLGAVMYYLLTGRRPFTGKSAIEILTNNMTKPPPHPHTVDKMIPAGLVEISLRLLEKHPNDRYQSARVLQDELAKWRKSKDGRMELERHKKIMKLRAMKAKKRKA